MTRPRTFLILLSLMTLWVAPSLAAQNFTVNSTGDAGDSNTGDGVCDDGAGNCTLRAAIQQANATGADSIHFDIPGVGPHTIALATGLPTITDPVVIDGYTQPGASPNTNPVPLGLNTVLMIELDGGDAGVDVTGLTITAGNTTVRGLAINRFEAGGGIFLGTNDGNLIQGNFIGTDVAGTEVPPGPRNGFGVGIFSADNAIGGTEPAARNLISANATEGIRLPLGSETGSVIQGSLIGTDVTGVAPLGNGSAGARIGKPSTTLGGTTSGAATLLPSTAMRACS